MIVCVTGSTRCGSSLMMRMLHAGGIPAYADNLVSCESLNVNRLPSDTSWLHEAEGHAIKIPEPLHYIPPKDLDWRFIFMRRDYQEQAKSQVKFANLVMGMDLPARAVKVLARSLADDYPKMLALLKERGPVLEVSFENLLTQRVEWDALDALDALAGQPLDHAAMVAQIVPRSPRCLPGLLELALMGAGS